MRRNHRQRARPKHQHWVPQFYLRYFATPDTRDSRSLRVWIFSKDPADGPEVLTNVRNVCGKRYLYSPRQHHGERSWDLDEKLTEVEKLLSQLWPTIAADYANLENDSLRKGLALFIATLHFRHPDVRRLVADTHRRLVAFYESALRRPDGTPDIDAVEIGGRDFEVDTIGWEDYKNWGRDDHDRFFAAFVQREAGRMANHLLTKPWSMVCAETDTFITTDKPVFLSHLTKERYGFGTLGSIITFPISPTRLLVLDDLHHELRNQYYPLKRSNAGSFNFTLWHGASRLLITGRNFPDVLAEICSSADEHDA